MAAVTIHSDFGAQEEKVCHCFHLHQLALLLLLLSRFSRVQLCVTPEMAAHQALTSLGLSRQEHWSGLPFPSPMHESEKWKRSRSIMSNSERPHRPQPTRLLHPWDFPGKSTGVGCHCLLLYQLTGHQRREHNQTQCVDLNRIHIFAINCKNAL